MLRSQYVVCYLGLVPVLLAIVKLVGADCWGQDRLRIDQLQLLGTHNSYRLAPDEFSLNVIKSISPQQAQALDYSHLPLTEQLEQLNIRHLELDLFRDPEGKLFHSPLGYRAAREGEIAVPVFDPGQKMKQPGIKVLHSPDYDFRTTIDTLIAGLVEIKEWSDKNPGHVPLFILLELKTESFSPTTQPFEWDEKGFDELESEIIRVFSRKRILTPDDIRGSHATLRDAVKGKGWPLVDDHRGQVAFLLDNTNLVRDRYLEKSEVLQGRLMFVSVSQHHPAAAWMKRNDPVASFEEIKELTQAGFLVRTRADADTHEARTNDTMRRDRAISSGAQLISTDYPKPDTRFSAYHVKLPIVD